MSAPISVVRRYQCLEILDDGQPCGAVFDDDTGRAPCPDCGNDDDATINLVDDDELEEEEAPPRRSAPKAKKRRPARPAKPARPAARTNGHHKQSAIVNRATLARSRTTIERSTAWGLLLLSVAGTVAALAGGWPALLAAPSLAAIVGGLVIQGGLTYLEWAYYHSRVLSGGARLIDAALTALGFGPLFLAALTRFFAAAGVTSVIAGQPGAVVAAWGAIAIASYGLAWYPESRLVD